MQQRCRRFWLLIMLSGVLWAAACDKPRRTAEDSSSDGQPRALAAGREFVDISLPNGKGEVVSLERFAGKVVLVNFWATWCAPCVAEMPALERLYKTYKDKGLAVVAITVDSEDAKPKVQEFIQRVGLSFPVLYDSELTLPPKLGITGFPETFFVGPDGKLLKFVDPDAKKSMVRIISDRPWDSPVYLEAVGALLEKHLPDDPQNT